MQVFMMVVAVSVCVVGGAFTAMYFLNKSVDKADR
jgi:hypothetical protein